MSDNPKIPRTVALIVEGGVLQAIVANNPADFAGVQFMLVDYDTEGSADDKNVQQIPQGEMIPTGRSPADGRKKYSEPAHVGLFSVDPCYFDVEAIARKARTAVQS